MLTENEISRIEEGRDNEESDEEGDVVGLNEMEKIHVYDYSWLKEYKLNKISIYGEWAYNVSTRSQALIKTPISKVSLPTW